MIKSENASHGWNGGDADTVFWGWKTKIMNPDQSLLHQHDVHELLRFRCCSGVWDKAVIYIASAGIR